MRIAIGGIHIECSTANPVLTQLTDFRVTRGAALLDEPNFAALRASSEDLFPVLHARAIPGGPVARHAYDALKAEFLDGLRAHLPLDGVYLALHGAMFVEGLEDAEGDWIVGARQVVGDDCLLVASFDLHGNLSRRSVDALDGLTNYRTAPHIDVEQTQRRAFEMLSRCLREGLRPTVSWCPVPVLLPGERTSTEDEPARSLYAALPDEDARPGVLEAALFVGYVWADEPRATASAVITAHGLPRAEQLQRTAELARRYWDARHAFQFGSRVGTIAECVRWATDSPTRPVILADSGDNPTGGGVGDRGDVLAEVLRQGARDVLCAGITDAPAVQACFEAGEGAAVQLTVGGSLDPAGERVPFSGEVLRLDDSENRQAVVRGAGVTLVLAERRRPYHDLRDFTRLDLHPKDFHTVVVKSGYLSPELAPLANPNLMALSDGVINQDISSLPRQRIHRPTFPWDDAFEWTPAPHLSARGER